MTYRAICKQYFELVDKPGVCVDSLNPVAIDKIIDEVFCIGNYAEVVTLINAIFDHIQVVVICKAEKQSGHKLGSRLSHFFIFALSEGSECWVKIRNHKDIWLLNRI